MDKTIAAVLIIHAIERLIAVGIGGLCIFLGWNLFSRNLDHSGEADVRHLAWRVTLKRIGPGVFFALFGAAVVGTALMRPITADVRETWLKSIDDGAHPAPADGKPPLTQAPPGGAQQVTQYIISGFGSGTAEVQRLSVVHALNSAIRVGTMNRNEKVIFNATVDDLRRGAKQLQRIRDAIVAQQFGKEAVDLWNEKGEQFQGNVNNLTKEEQDADISILNKVMPWMTNGMETEPEVAK